MSQSACKDCGKYKFDPVVYSGKNISIVKSITNNPDTLLSENSIPTPFHDTQDNSVAFFAKDFKAPSPSPDDTKLYILQKITMKSYRTNPIFSYAFKILENTNLVPGKSRVYYEMIILDRKKNGTFSTRLPDGNLAVGAYPTGEDVFTLNYVPFGLHSIMERGDNYIIPSEYVEETKKGKEYSVFGWDNAFVVDINSAAGSYPYTKSEPNSSLVRLANPSVHTVMLQNGNVTERIVLPVNSNGVVINKRQKDFNMIKHALQDTRTKEVLYRFYNKESVDKLIENTFNQKFISID